MSKPPTAPKAQREQAGRNWVRRAAIITAAQQVFLERGFDAASMHQIAVRQGGSKQTLYNYFPSKETLFVAVMLERGVRRLDPILDVFEGDLPPREALTRFARDFLGFATGDEALAFRRMSIAQGAASRLGTLFFENGPRRFWGRLADYLAQAMDAGTLRRADPWKASMHFQGLCEAGPFQRRLDGSLSELPAELIDEIADEAVDAFLRAYGAARDH